MRTKLVISKNGVEMSKVSQVVNDTYVHNKRKEEK